MATASVKEFGKAWWSEVYNRCIGAVVFLDDASAECLHYEGGLLNLLSAGAIEVRSLSPFEFASEGKHKAVFITQTTSTQLQTISVIIKNSDFTYCTLISCVGLDVVYMEMNPGRNATSILEAGNGPAEATKILESMLLEWMAVENQAVEVVHIPIFTAALTLGLFVTPPYHNVYPLYDGKLNMRTPVIDIYALPQKERTNVRRLASALNSMLDSMNLKEDIFYMGTYSCFITKVLENSPTAVARRENCQHPASLIIIDRTMDLSGVTTHSSESMLDKIISVLPRFPGHSNEVAVNMSTLATANVFNHPDDVHLSPGCLFHARDESSQQTFDLMINKSQKEVMIDLYSKLANMDLENCPSPKTRLKVTPQSLEKIVTSTKGNYDIIMKYLGVLQQALGVVQTLKSPRRAQAELIVALERQGLQSLAASRDSTSLIHQISLLIKSRKERNIPLDRILALLVYIYSLSGDEVTFCQEHQDSLKETLSVAIFEDHKTLFVNEVGAIVTPEECDEASKKIVAQLLDIAQMRKKLQNYNGVLLRSEGGAPPQYYGLVERLVDELVDARRPAIPDLIHKPPFKDLFRSGFQLLTSKKSKTKHPLDHATVVIFVIGGTTAEESKRVHRRVITSGVDNTFIFGSTKLVSPVEAMRDVLQI